MHGRRATQWEESWMDGCFGKGPPAFLNLLFMWTYDSSGSSLPHCLLLLRSTIMALINSRRKTGNALFSFCLLSLELAAHQEHAFFAFLQPALCCFPPGGSWPWSSIVYTVTGCLSLPNSGLPQEVHLMLYISYIFHPLCHQNKDGYALPSFILCSEIGCGEGDAII